jgi:hypothetical protein
MKIDYVKPPYYLACKFSELQIKQQQKAFIIKYVDLVDKGTNLLFLDEMSTHLWERRTKVWSSRQHPIYQRLAP